MRKHKNKTLATGLASFTGWAGIHRFYLHGPSDLAGWAHVLAVLLSVPALLGEKALFSTFAVAPLVISTLISFLEALVIGLTPDDKWDAQHNQASGLASDSRWPLAVLLVLTTGVGATAMIATMARMFDLLWTGGAYG